VDEATEILAIQRLKARYFRFLDTKDWVKFRQVFTDDVRAYRNDEQQPMASGGDAWVSMVSTILATAVTVHHGHTPEIYLTGQTTAEGVWAMFDWVDDPEHGRAVQGYGHYHETYEKGADGEWRIKQTRLMRLRVEPMPPTDLAVVEERRGRWYIAEAHESD
jgi:SnoaL-like protein